MKKSLLLGLRWGMDAGFLVAVSWFLSTLLIVGLQSISFGLRAVTEDFLYWCAFPLLIGAITGGVFSFILIRFYPSKSKYILLCVLLGMLPMYPFIWGTILGAATKGLHLLPISLVVPISRYIIYLAMCVLLSNHIYQHIQLPSDVLSTST